MDLWKPMPMSSYSSNLQVHFVLQPGHQSLLLVKHQIIYNINEFIVGGLVIMTQHMPR